ncbi:hypothetical protein AKJ09_10870 [Labilithrix luteola]|uniref:Uncharacterized protein n=1 Tax=Labilithrix luteola TaxID=1391654 RepID=A0A0K1QEY5_9BACT|nr:hypothetical protein AKJ09_10870 [Labilithrix luteola]
MPYREKVLACARGGTFKYFLPRDEVMPAWRRLEATFGLIVVTAATHTMQIESKALILRATHLGNPITVFRKRACRAEDVDVFHGVIGFSEDDEEKAGGK